MVGIVVNICLFYNFKIIQSLALTLCLSTVFFVATNDECQAVEPVYTYIDQIKYHPDGFVGKPNLLVAVSYGSVKKAPGEPVVDQQQYRFDISLIPFNYLTLIGDLTAFKEDTVRYKIAVGGRIYLSDPINSTRGKNPDGVIGRPVIEGTYGFYYSGINEDEKSGYFGFGSRIPIANYLTGFLGFYSYDSLPKFETNELYAGIRIFLKTYQLSQPYRNPDVAVNGVGVEIKGSQSDYGSSGEITCFVGVSRNSSITFSVAAQFLDPPYDRQLIGGIGIALYPNF